MAAYWSAVICGFLALCLAKQSSGELFFDPKIDYRPEEFDSSNRGSLDLPPCIKMLLNCWQFIRPEVVCKSFNVYTVILDTMCSDLRFQCREYTGPTQWPALQDINSVYNYCSKNAVLAPTTWILNRQPPTQAPKAQ